MAQLADLTLGRKDVRFILLLTRDSGSRHTYLPLFDALNLRLTEGIVALVLSLACLDLLSPTLQEVLGRGRWRFEEGEVWGSNRC